MHLLAERFDLAKVEPVASSVYHQGRRVSFDTLVKDLGGNPDLFIQARVNKGLVAVVLGKLRFRSAIETSGARVRQEIDVRHPGERYIYSLLDEGSCVSIFNDDGVFSFTANL